MPLLENVRTSLDQLGLKYSEFDTKDKEKAFVLRFESEDKKVRIIVLFPQVAAKALLFFAPLEIGAGTKRVLKRLPDLLKTLSLGTVQYYEENGELWYNYTLPLGSDDLQSKQLNDTFVGVLSSVGKSFEFLKSEQESSAEGSPTEESKK